VGNKPRWSQRHEHRGTCPVFPLTLFWDETGEISPPPARAPRGALRRDAAPRPGQSLPRQAAPRRLGPKSVRNPTLLEKTNPKPRGFLKRRMHGAAWRAWCLLNSEEPGKTGAREPASRCRTRGSNSEMEVMSRICPRRDLSHRSGSWKPAPSADVLAD